MEAAATTDVIVSRQTRRQIAGKEEVVHLGIRSSKEAHLVPMSKSAAPQETLHQPILWPQKVCKRGTVNTRQQNKWTLVEKSVISTLDHSQMTPGLDGGGTHCVRTMEKNTPGEIG